VRRGFELLVWSDRLIRSVLHEALFSYLLLSIRRPNSSLSGPAWITEDKNTHRQTSLPLHQELTKAGKDKTDTCDKTKRWSEI